jgi:S-adenosylmethionine synthetase
MLKQNSTLVFPAIIFFSLNFKSIFIMAYLFTSESGVRDPDKIADQISDALIDNFSIWC